jgi:hypothetical protein
LGLVAAASPLAVNTLTESLSLLSAEIGKSFTPVIVDLAMTIQGAVKWWRQLDPAIKENVVQVGKFVAVAGGAVLALGAITKVVGVLAGLGLGPIGWAVLGGAALLSTGRETPMMVNAKGEKVVDWKAEGKHLQERADQTRKGVVGQVGIAGEAVAKRMLGKKKAEADAGGMLGSFGPSSMGSLQDFARKMMVDATSGSEIQSQELKIQTEMRDGVIEMVKIMKEKQGGQVVK